MKHKSGLVAQLALAGALGSFLFGTTRDARACGGEWIPYMETIEQIDHRPQGVARAEKSFEKGATDKAAASVIRMMPHVRNLEVKSSPLVARAMRLLAVSVARHDGRLPVAREVPAYAQGKWLGKSEQDRVQNLDWAIGVLRDVRVGKAGDPTVETDLAEALSKLDSHHEEARTLLEALAKKDLISTPEGYAALARLRKSAGDGLGGELALKRCEAMAKSAGACAAGRAQG
jgi:hypothetical protein